MARRGLVTVLLVAAVTLVGCARHTKPADRPTLTVHGAATIDAEPDTLTVVLGVQTTATAAAAALTDNNNRSQQLLQQLKGIGVADRDVQTSQLSINPNYDAKGKITGYMVTNQVTAKLRQLGKAGELIDAAAAAAGDAVRVQSFAFSIEPTNKAFENARAAAVKDAVNRAKTITRAGGIHLGRVRTITDDTQPQAQPALQFAASGALAAGSAGVAGAFAPAAPIAAGTQQVTSSVTIVYELS